MDLIIIIILFLGGILAGLYASSVGGGALVTFPLLILSGLPTTIAIATNRFSAVLLELSSAARFYREKKLDLRHGLKLGITAAAGSIIGSRLILEIDEKALNIIIALLLISIFTVLLNKDKLGIKEEKKTQRHTLKTYAFTFILGIYGGFFGAGFGTFIMFLLVISGYTFIQSAATGRVIGTMMSLAATIVFASSGMIDYTYGLTIGAGTIVGGWAGAGIAIEKGNKFIRALFIIMIILTTIKLVMSFLN